MRLDAPVRVSVGGALALAVGLGVGRFAFTPLLPMMQADAGVSLVTGSWLAAANYVGYLVGALVCIRWRPESAAAIRIALLAVALATLGMALTDDLTAWLVLRVIAGAASAAVLVAASAWALERLAENGRPRLAAAVFAGVGLGIVVAGALVVAAMALGAHSHVTWLALGSVALTVTIASWDPLFGDASDARTSPASSKPPLSSARPQSRRTLGLVLCYGACGFAYIIPATFLPAAARQLVSDPLVFGLSWPLFGSAGAVSTFIAGALARRWTDRRIWIGSCLVMAAGVIAPAVSGAIGALFVAALAVGGTFLVITMVALREARSIAGPDTARTIAAMTAAFAVGQIVGPLVGGWLTTLGGSFSLALVTAGAALVTAAAVLSWDASHPLGVAAITAEKASA